jgi:LmbE family N-acetylglucosaminyl deacetylase
MASGFPGSLTRAGDMKNGNEKFMKKTQRASKKLRILAIGAHPDDCEILAGGSAALWSDAGHSVCFVSATNGGTGHHAIGGIELVGRRLAEAAAAAKVLGVESRVLDITNGELEPSLVYRRLFIKLIREFMPDLILTHRPNDYHPDHRYTSQLVQDSSYVVTVPNNLPTVTALRHSPAIAYFADNFTKPIAFAADVAVDTDPVIERKIDAMSCHVSQFFEWLPWNKGIEAEVPAGAAQRRKWLGERMYKRFTAAPYKSALRRIYGAKAAAGINTAEAFEICEYGAALSPQQIREIFPVRR